jgi:DNA modification methylase
MTEPVVIGNANLYLGDCLDVLPRLPHFDALISDPPYPNNAGHFDESIPAARLLLEALPVSQAIIFWSELEAAPSCGLPLVAVHVWHRTNVNGRPYEPAYHFARDGVKRRSDVINHAAVFDGVGPGCNEYAGHPTQKPVALMERLVLKTAGIVLDPFMGSGSTGVACMRLGRAFIGVEKDPTYFEIACRRIDEAYRQAPLIPHEQPEQQELV